MLCEGIQHPRLAEFGKKKENHPFCSTKWSLLCGRWHSQLCTMAVNLEGSKTRRRCSKCEFARRNIKKDRLPQLFPEPPPEQPSDSIDEEDTSNPSSVQHDTDADLVAVSKLILPDEGAIRDLIRSMIAEHGEDKLPDSSAMQMAVSVLKLTGRNPFQLDAQRSIAICRENGCDAWAFKKPRSNIGLRCDECAEVSKRTARSIRRKEANKALRVAANSSVNMRYLDSTELKTRTANLNRNRYSAG